jgi:hypothetical protein
MVTDMEIEYKVGDCIAGARSGSGERIIIHICNRAGGVNNTKGALQ